MGDKEPNEPTHVISQSIRNELAELPNQQQGYLQQATADNTRRAYRAAVRQFELHGGLLPATEEDIARYMTLRASALNPRTLSLHLTALSQWHRYQKLPDPTQAPQIRKLLTGIHRQHGRPKRKAKALHPEHIEQMIALCRKQNSLKSLRDSALIQAAYFGAFRRSELVKITVDHLHFDSKGLLILLPRSKTDQTGEGKIKALPYGNDTICPVLAMKSWLRESMITEGVVFRGINRWDTLQAKPLHPDSVNTIIKSIASACKFDFVAELSSHSTRRGFATSASMAGAEFANIKRQGGWKNDNTVREYIEEGQLFDKNAAEQLMKHAFSKVK